VTTNVCVESTARDAFMRDWQVVLLETARRRSPPRPSTTRPCITCARTSGVGRTRRPSSGPGARPGDG